MTQPFKTTELDAIIKEAEIQSRLTGYVAASLFDRMADAARASIPRPISEEPMDGTVVERCPHCGYTEEDKRFHMDHYLCDAKSARGPIPKGGVS